MDDFGGMTMESGPDAENGTGAYDAASEGGAATEPASPGLGTAGAVPESAEGYILPQSWEGEGVPGEIAAQVSGILESDRETFMEVCHACELTDTQAAALFDALGKTLAGSLAEDNAAYNRNLEETVTGLWPKDTARNVEIARRGARFLRIGNELDAEGLSAHPLVLRMVHAVGRMVGEDAMRGNGAAKGGLPVGEAARVEMLKVIQSDAYRRNDPAALRKVEALAARVKR
ncbi:MAG: hypothetical protein LIP28_06855 [Deltaproteobacteria bacterium]|nr:hypothetical protein [Deltaproteobacteria bacterium]